MNYTRGAIKYSLRSTPFDQLRSPMESTPVPGTHRRKIRSFVRRPGRITPAQRRALDELLPRFALAGDAMLDLDAAYGRAARRVLEIGFGDGEALVTCAANEPSIDYLGIEVHEPGIGHCLLLIERARVTNVRLIAGDAAEVVRTALRGESCDAVKLLFPDPWPKKRHHKRRLVQPLFLAELVRVLRPGGLLHLATDWAEYAEHMRATLAAEPRLRSAEAHECVESPLAFRPPTKFERRGRRLGHDVVDLYYLKTGNQPLGD